MRIYVAGAFADRVTCKKLMTKLAEAGHIITHDWTNEGSKDLKDDELTRYLRKCAMEDVNGVATCNVLVLINHDRGRGSQTEFGMALALSKTIFVLNPNATKNIFFNLHEVRICDTEDDLMWQLTLMERGKTSENPASNAGSSGTR